MRKFFEYKHYNLFKKKKYIKKMLKNIQNARKISLLPSPPQKPMDSKRIFNQKGVNWKDVLKFLEAEGKIDIFDFIKIITLTIEILKNQPNLIKIQDPLTIVGDIHGQFYDLINILKSSCGGDPSRTKYLFLGDYVDRGSFSVEVLILLFSLKITYPKSIILLRGNHQCRNLTSFFSFKLQCLTKYNQDVYELIMQLFDCMPLACLVNNKFLCIHGGISHQLQNLKDIYKINRFQEIPKIGLFCDLLWADPTQDPQGITQKLIKPNDVRGCSYYFGYELSKYFMNKNKVFSIIRAHQAQQQGFKFNKWDGRYSLPTVITIFSAPNYCDFYNNKGAIIKIKHQILTIQQFSYSVHPFILPNFMNVFEWSIPFISQKIAQILQYIIKPEEQVQIQQKMTYELSIKKRIIQELLLKTKKKRQKNEMMIKFSGYCPDNKLLQSGNYQESINMSFDEKRAIDISNQKYPDFQEAFI